MITAQREKETNESLNSSKKINKMISEILSYMSKMSTIVAMQESKIERIDRVTCDSEVNISQGKKEVEQIYDNVKGKRAMILKIFAILIFFSVIYVVFLL